MVPESVDGARVIMYASVFGGARGASRVARVAICQYPEEQGFYLFSCDEEFHSLGDTWHENLEQAIERAELEHHEVSARWFYPPGASAVEPDDVEKDLDR